MKFDRFWRVFDRIFCAHWYWEKIDNDHAVCRMCGKQKRIDKLKPSEILCK